MNLLAQMMELLRMGGLIMFEGNIFINSFAISFRHHVNNSRVSTITKNASEIDSLLDFESFRSFVIQLKRSEIREGGTFGTNRLASESLFYGHLKALIEYAGLEYGDRYRLIFPNIEHGIGWLQRVPNNVHQPYVHCAVAQGDYRKKLICSQRSGMPFYTVGPYIHYAAQYYSDFDIEKMKSRLGRTLLVFPAHTYELSDVTYAKERFVDNIMQRLACSFDSVLVSAYWHDADDEVFSLFERAGARVVSCGLREDPLFISRLKTLITLSDAIAGNALGTHIGYCEYLNKPFYMIDDDAAVIADVGNGFRSEEERQLDEVFRAASNLYKAGGDSARRLEFYRRYWGGSDAIKTPEEVRCMIGISEDVLRLSHGRTIDFARVTGMLLDEAKGEESGEGVMRYRLLSQAMERV